MPLTEQEGEKSKRNKTTTKLHSMMTPRAAVRLSPLFLRGDCCLPSQRSISLPPTLSATVSPTRRATTVFRELSFCGAAAPPRLLDRQLTSLRCVRARGGEQQTRQTNCSILRHGTQTFTAESGIKWKRERTLRGTCSFFTLKRSVRLKDASNYGK